MRVRIDYLVNHQRHIPTLASWLKAQDAEFFAAFSLSDIAREHFESRLNTDSLPISYIALINDLPVGTIALLTSSVTTHTHLGPWLGALYVRPDHRHQGIGMRLVAQALKKARELGVGGVYAGISSSAEDIYTREGWRVTERVLYCGQPMSIMRYELL